MSHWVVVTSVSLPSCSLRSNPELTAQYDIKQAIKQASKPAIKQMYQDHIPPKQAGEHTNSHSCLQADDHTCWLFAALGALFALVDLVALVLVACQTRAK
jgi:hypothetical protein